MAMDASGNGRGTWEVKTGLAQMLKGGVIMDVVTAEQAKIAEDAGGLRRHGAGASAVRYPGRWGRRPHGGPQQDP